MPVRAIETYHCDQVETFLLDQGLAHLRVRKYGNSVIVESGPTGDAIKHIRFRRDTVHLWLLDVADNRGRWERTPFRGPLDDALALVIQSFPWVLVPCE